MEQQHQNYEYSETFGFINAAFGSETENFSLPQENAPKAIADFNSTTAISANADYNNPPIYGVPPETVQTCPNSQYLKTETAEQELPDNNISIRSGSTNDTENIQSHAESLINKNSENKDEKENDIQAAESTENATSEENLDKTSNCNEEPSESNESNDRTRNSDSKPFNNKKDTMHKKRRRILILNDDDSDNDGDLDAIKEEILSNEQDQENEKSQDLENFADNEDGESDNEKIEAEMPVNRNFLKAKHLLKSAVIIHDPDKKKKKKKQRILESDEEDQIHTSVDDIGLMNDENEEEELMANDIVIINDNPFETSVENKSEDLNSTISNDQIESSENIGEIKNTENKLEKDTTNDEKSKDNEELPKSEENKNEQEDVEAILEKIQPMDDDDDFFKFNDSSDEDEKKGVPNDEYFGTPSGTSKGRKRGPRPGTRRNTDNSKSAQRSRKRGSKYEKDFVDDSESSSSYSDSLSSSSESSTERVSRQKAVKPVIKKPPITVQKTITVAKLPLNRPPISIANKKDRFFDKSRNIPNDVYFGDVKVPLHVLHSRWNSDGSQRAIRKPVNIPVNRNIPRIVNAPATAASTSKTTVQHFRAQQEEDTKLTVMKEFMRIAGLKINYTKLFSNARSTDHKCMLLRRILAQKGIEGEPTLAKCRKLKLEMQAKREIAELDKSVILNTEGRTRRSRRGVSSRESDESLGASNNEVESTSVPPQILETLTKIKSVIDSDSE